MIDEERKRLIRLVELLEAQVKEVRKELTGNTVKIDFHKWHWDSGNNLALDKDSNAVVISWQDNYVLFYNHGTDLPIDFDESHPYAKLIEKAPEMFHLLKACIEDGLDDNLDNKVRCLINNIDNSEDY